MQEPITARLERVIRGIAERCSRIMIDIGDRITQKVGDALSKEQNLTEEEKTLGSIAAQLMNGEQVLVAEQKISVRRVGRGRLRMVQFRMNGRVFEAIEQNRDKPSHWGKLAREKHQVVQFRDMETRRYVAVAVDGKVLEYGR